MSTKKQEKPYGFWKPIITANEVYSESLYLSQIQTYGEDIFWLELRPHENGRVILVKKSPNKEPRDITPKNFSVKSRVHEYGGGAYAIGEEYVFFVNQEDQRIYRQKHTIPDKPEPLTPEKNANESLGKYASLTLSPDELFLLFVYEKEYTEEENVNTIAILDLAKKEPREPHILIEGNDFYADPIFSPDSKKIAWLTWNHPNMPWETTKLMMCTFHPTTLEISEQILVAGGLNQTIYIPKFSPDGTLYFIQDRQCEKDDVPENWSNIYRYQDNQIMPVTKKLVEFGQPQWVFKLSTYDFLTNKKLVARYFDKGKTTLLSIDVSSNESEILCEEFTEISNLQISSNNKVIFTGGNPQLPNSIIYFNPENKTYDILRKSHKLDLNEEKISIPQFLSFPTSDEEEAYGYLYLPHNPNFVPPPDSLGPLLIFVHGGPTGRTNTNLDPRIQFWTSLGFAIFDIDHRGSTGYGRKYREALYNRWGVIDTYDIYDGIQYLQDENFVGADVFISGGSAGGYAVQRALTKFPEIFSGGASYYGIGNLKTLVKITHKFESHYLDTLIGGTIEEMEEVYNERSPIYHLEDLKVPMIIFQGSEDKIVPSEISKEMVEALKKKGIKHQYIEYEEEAHGFRKKKNKVDALKKEAEFYQNILKEKKEEG
ncbi:MAG: prolyl oligopeptidase family serine peptidase [Asgard group archaeon]|nr:prolyl oligopeptidase family serine peptidase [Asgard group archaeon]